MSNRKPWVRGGALGLVPFLVPFTWALELDSCGHSPQETAINGTTLLSKLEVEAWAIIGPALAISVLTPFIALKLASPIARMLNHLAGMIAALFSLYLAAFLILFTIFSERVIQPAGATVIGLFLLSGADSVWRFVSSVIEWRRGRAP